MEIKELVVSIVVILGIAIGTTVSSTLSESELLKPKAEFIAEIEPYLNNSTHGEKIIIYNIGNAQAKNAVLFLGSKKPIQITNNVCPEGEQISSKKNISHKINFEKFSTNIKCVFEFSDSPLGNINSLILNADDTPGYEHQFGKDERKKPSFLPSLIPGFSGYEYLTIFVSFMSAGIALLYLLYTRSGRRGTLAYIDRREGELKNESSLLKNEFNFIENTIKEKGIENLSPETISRRSYLIERSSQVSNDLNEAAILKKEYTLYSEIADFFNKWHKLEEQIRLLLGTTPLIRSEYQTTSSVLNELQNKEFLDEEMISNLKTINHFRNSLIHGNIKPSKKSFNKFNSQLSKLIEQLKEIKPPVQFVVRIPIGTSVPGCEKTNKCFDPPELPIKENQIVTWYNNDTAAHSITSGTPESGSDGKFDSSLFMSQDTFSHKFKKKGIYHYFCLVHPWQKGIIIVE